MSFDDVISIFEKTNMQMLIIKAGCCFSGNWVNQALKKQKDLQKIIKKGLNLYCASGDNSIAQFQKFWE